MFFFKEWVKERLIKLKCKIMNTTKYIYATKIVRLIL